MAIQNDPKNVDLAENNLVPVGVSNRHIHLSKEHVEALFGPGYELTPMKDLTQPGQFACKELLNVVGKKGVIQGVRILGPARSMTQVELSQTDARQAGIDAPLKDSGDINGTPGCILIGPKGPVVIDKGCIVARGHVHLHPSDAERMGIKDGDTITVSMKGQKEVSYSNILARVGEAMCLDFHLDTDEANAAMVKTGDMATITNIKKA